MTPAKFHSQAPFFFLFLQYEIIKDLMYTCVNVNASFIHYTNHFSDGSQAKDHVLVSWLYRLSCKEFIELNQA